MQGVLIAPLTMFLLFQFFLGFFLVDKRDIIPSLAFSALQPHYICHTLSLRSNYAPWRKDTESARTQKANA
jgi:hypothetical protein